MLLPAITIVTFKHMLQTPVWPRVSPISILGCSVLFLFSRDQGYIC